MEHQGLTLTPRMERLLDDAARFARDNGHGYIGTEHVLNALAMDDGGVASSILAELGVRNQVPSRISSMIASEMYNTEVPFPSE